MICYIPTKSRPNTKTHKLFEKVGIQVIHFIEPQEMDLYDVPCKVNIGATDQGVPYVRNFMMKYARERGHEWIVMCDDDISDFGVVVNGRNKSNKDASIWLKILEKAKKLPFEAYGVSYAPYSWSETKPYSINKKLFASVMLLNTKKITWDYDNGMKEDYKMLVDCIIKGNGIVKFNQMYFSAPAMGSNKGGLHESYEAGLDQEANKILLMKYNGFAKLKKFKDRYEVKIDLEGIAKKYGKQVK